MYQAYIRNLWYYLRQPLVESNGRWRKTRSCISIPISTKSHWSLIIKIAHATVNESFLWRALRLFYQRPINSEKPGTSLRGKYGNIVRDVFVHLASIEYVFYISLQSFVTCGRSVKETVFSFISYCIFFNHSSITCAQIFLLTNHSLPNPLLPDFSLRNAHSLISLSPISLAPWSLAWSHPPVT